MTRYILATFAVWTSFAFTSSIASAAEANKRIETIYKEAKLASVEVLVDGHLGGSGCFISKEGLIVTAAHILAPPGRKVEIVSADGARQSATPVAVDLGHDLALLRVDPRDGGYPVLPLAAELPPTGGEVFLYGTPVYRHGIIQRGMIARGALTFEHQSHFVEVIQVAALVQEGTSGGPWLNRRGEVIGIQSGSITNKSIPAGIANVAPVAPIRSLLKSKRNAATPTIGVFVDETWILPPKELLRFPPGTQGVIVQHLRDDGPAARAGIKKGEVIIRAGNSTIRYRDDFVRAIRMKKPNNTIQLSLVSPDGTNRRNVTVPIGKLEAAWPEDQGK